MVERATRDLDHSALLARSNREDQRPGWADGLAVSHDVAQSRTVI
jgi:hypothetical protein